MNDSISQYNDSAEAYASSRLGSEDKEEIEQFASRLKPKSRILDVGCAAGRDTHIFKEMGFDAIGIDLANKLLDIARIQYPEIRFEQADMHVLPFHDGTVDAIWASAVLHHVGKGEMQTVIREFWRVLSPKGLVYVHTKAGKGRLSTHEASVAGKKREFELVSAEELDTLLREAGFQKLAVAIKASRSRPGLQWLNATYRKTS